MSISTQRPRVLVCDDSEKQYLEIKQFLEVEKFECDSRVDRYERVHERLNKATVTGRPYHAVMIDVDLRGGGETRTGVQVYESLLHDFPNEDYIIYSSNDTREFRDEINRLRFREVQLVLLDEVKKNRDVSLAFLRLFNREHLKRVFVVSGQDKSKNRRMETLLNKAFGLEVVRWERAKTKAGNKDYIFEIVVAGMQMSGATLVLFTDEERTGLKKERRGSAKAQDRQQSRPNVYIEAGYAMGVRRRRTVLVEWPDKGSKFTQASDFAGIHMARFDGSPDSREVLRSRLEAARCVLRLAKNWKTMSLGS